MKQVRFDYIKRSVDYTHEGINIYVYVDLHNIFRGHSLHNVAMKVKLKFTDNDERPANWLILQK
jgi:hypothetical protein